MLAVRTVGEDVHLLPVFRAAADVPGDGPFVLVEIAPDEGDVAALDRVVEELFGQPGMGLFVLGDHEEPRSVLVDAVNQPGAVLLLGRDSLGVEVVHQGVDQRSGIVPHPGVDDHSGGFVDDQQMVVLVGDVERDVFGHEFRFASRVGQHDLDTVQGFDLVARLGGLSVDEDVPAVGRGLDAVS